MPRKPVSELRGGVSPRQRAWTAIRAQAGAEWTADEIILATRNGSTLGDVIDAGTLQTYLLCLAAAGIVRVSREEPARGRAPASRKWYVLVRDEGTEAPRVRRDGSRVTQGLAQEQMWRTLRMLGNGDTNARELAAHASSTAAAVAERSAAAYLQMLARAGYLDCTRPGKGLGCGGVQARYRLRADHNTGPMPPMVCRTKVVFDPNLHAVVWAPVVTEEDADHGR